MQPALRKEIRYESHPIDFVWQQRSQLEARSLVRDEPRLHASLTQQSEVMPGQDRFAAETGRRIRRDDYDFHLAAVENTQRQ